MNEMKKEVKRLFDGLFYHCMEITKFMESNIRDEYFKTDEGSKLMGYLTKICLNHAMGSMIFLMDDFKPKELNKNENDFESILKGILDNKDGA